MWIPGGFMEVRNDLVSRGAVPRVSVCRKGQVDTGCVRVFSRDTGFGTDKGWEIILNTLCMP